jgi:hypothetical protein
MLSTANDLIAYAAGAVVVIYNYKRNKQVGFLYPPPVNSNQNTNNNTNQNNSTSQTTQIPLITPLGGPTNNEILTTSNQNNSTDDNKKQTPASTRAKPISCLTFSPDGNYLAAGEVRHTSFCIEILTHHTN